jgi:lysophospholipase L1-like esterase
VRHRAAGALAGLVVLSMAACQKDDVPPPADDLTQYVALGDSHTAAPHTPEDDPTVPCYRSPDNYPALVADELTRIELIDVSCSGATSAAMTGEQNSWGTMVPPQLDALSEDTDLVTVNIGGNDENLFLSWAGPCAQVTALDPQGSPCADNNKTANGDALLDVIPRIQRNLSMVLDEIKERAPDATVIVVTYPKPFPDRGTCRLASTYAVGDHAYINTIMETLSDAMIAAAKDAGVEWVDVARASKGHDICSETPWTNGITTDQTRANVLHPFPEEQAAVAQLILEKL